MTTPFYTGTVPYAGVSPGIDESWSNDVVPGEFWLGRVDRGLVQLPSPMADGYQVSLSLGESPQGLASNATAAALLGGLSRVWQLPYQFLYGRDLQVILGFYLRAFGRAPWAFLPPEDDNRLTRVQSMCGAARDRVEGWQTSIGDTLTIASSVTAYESPSGVLQWTPTAANHLLAAGVDGGTLGYPDLKRGVPNVPALPLTFSIAVQAVSGTTTVRPRLSPRDVTGNLVGTATTGPAVTVSAGAWTRLQLSVPASAFAAGVAYVVPILVASGGGAVYVSNPQLEYASTASDWRMGFGVPRVTIAQPMGDMPTDVFRTRQSTVVLTQNVPEFPASG